VSWRTRCGFAAFHFERSLRRSAGNVANLPAVPMGDPEPMKEPPIDGMRPAHDPSTTPAICSHGSAVG
jgi:hypothetical protein